jgi:hypothetical protein
MGQFKHCPANVPLTYIIENNGVYGLTKGQFSATADEGLAQKQGTSPYLPVDIAWEALVGPPLLWPALLLATQSGQRTDQDSRDHRVLRC